MNYTEKLQKLLPLVEKPGRYMGGELNMAVKDPSLVSTRFGFAFPDTYEIGMSYLGLQIIYHLLNKEPDVYCERLFAPNADMETLMRENGLPLFTMETNSDAKDMDIIGFTLQYELSYTNILNMLDLAGIPFRSENRKNGQYPFLCAGGPCAFNPEPLAPFFDFFMIGDGEGTLQEVCRVHKEWKDSGASREEFLKAVSKVPGVYVPAFYEPAYSNEGAYIDRDGKGDYEGYRKIWEGAPDRVLRNICPDLNEVDYPTEMLTPLIEVVHDRAVVEVFRGCSRGCRFCQAGMIYRPVRERTKDRLMDLAKKQLSASGQEELSLMSLSTSDYSEFEPFATELMDYCEKENVALSLPSLRLDSFSFDVMNRIQGYKKTGLTVAPEAGTQRLRDVINKNITEKNIHDALTQAIDLGWTSVKLYFMDGLPTETDEDLLGIANVARDIMEIWFEHYGQRKCGKFSVTASVSNFVPKPFTPFQWVPQDSPEEFIRKHDLLRGEFRKLKGVFLQYHGSEASHMEAILARGDRRCADILEAAFREGCKFDAWRESFDYAKWEKAMETSGISGDRYCYYSDPTAEKPLPWDVIDAGVTKEFLQNEFRKAVKGETTQDCRFGCRNCGMNSHTECRTCNIWKGKENELGGNLY